MEGRRLPASLELVVRVVLGLIRQILADVAALVHVAVFEHALPPSIGCALRSMFVVREPICSDRLPVHNHTVPPTEAPLCQHPNGADVGADTPDRLAGD